MHQREMFGIWVREKSREEICILASDFLITVLGKSLIILFPSPLSGLEDSSLFLALAFYRPWLI